MAGLALYRGFGWNMACLWTALFTH